MKHCNNARVEHEAVDEEKLWKLSINSPGVALVVFRLVMSHPLRPFRYFTPTSELLMIAPEDSGSLLLQAAT